MVHTQIHAPDGGSIPGALCQEPTGDVSIVEDEVTCSDCLHELDEGERSFVDLALPIKDFWTGPQRAR
ncbi:MULTISPECIES: hypothetical protein [Mycobacterium avium complex (MAC)]|uniref:Uncharacterized protein n=1 Tax=Mycobacterium intracellulare subsp. chimaera TaxID=222805 RepID=A0ABT7P3K1_MYCIT|nr:MULTISPECIES: hypothetical protein [Mycobacterium avium complex (MAC)]MDM3927857.1 hypothetical protein [Mycobacterium intracellulare subsp. chimaera]